MICDILIVGGGVIGLNMARLLSRSGSVLLIDKDSCGFHTSGRNSGVVHAGIYYTPNSSKASLCVLGNKLLSDYCRSHGVGFSNLGKIITPKSDSELPVIDRLYERARTNGAHVEIIDYKQAKEIEPRIKEQGHYIWSPNTSIADNKGLIKALKEECLAKGVRIVENCKYLGRNTSHPSVISINTSTTQIECKFMVNCAGLYADKVAHSFGLGLNYQLLPFIGLYLQGKPSAPGFRTLVYPCPIGKNQFLGVHTTNKLDAPATLGPTATPALWREQYSGLENFSLSESLSSVGRYIKCLFSEERDLYLRLLKEELRKFRKKNLLKDAADIVTDIDKDDYAEWGKPGIFPQLIDRSKSTLIQDFTSVRGENSFHFLNIVSPGWTSSFALTEKVVSELNLN